MSFFHNLGKSIIPQKIKKGIKKLFFEVIDSEGYRESTLDEKRVVPVVNDC